MAEIVPNMKALDHACKLLPLKGAKGTIMGHLVYLLKLPPEGIDLANPYISTIKTGCTDLRMQHAE